MTTTAVTASGLALVEPRLPDQEPLVATADAIRTVLLAERTAKDLGHWEVVARAFAPDASVSVSWFRGPAADFVARARERAAGGTAASFHEIGPVGVAVNAGRALADASCAVHVRAVCAGAQVDVVSHGRLCWRVARHERGWRIASMDMIYLRDEAAPPGATAGLPLGDGVAPRLSYEHLQRVLTAAGHPVDPDLPGVDRPQLVEQLLAAHRDWLLAVPGQPLPDQGART